MKRLFLIVTLVGLLVSPISGRAAPILSAGLGPVTVAKVGSVFTVPVLITGATDLASWQFDISYSPSILQLNAVTEGTFMSSFGATLFGSGFDLGGLVSGVTDSYVDLAPYPNGSGVLASFEFTALALGVSPLSFSNVFLNFSDQGFDAISGAVWVVPEPSNLALVGLSLAALGLRSRRTNKPLPADS